MKLQCPRRPKRGFIEPMLLLRTEKLPEGPDWVVELKLDRYQALGVVSQPLGDRGSLGCTEACLPKISGERSRWRTKSVTTRR